MAKGTQKNKRRKYLLRHGKHNIACNEKCGKIFRVFPLWIEIIKKNTKN